MAAVKYLLGSRTALTTTALDSLASATYVSAGTITIASSSKTPLDMLVEVAVTPGTVASNKQVLVFLQESLDGTNFTTGPTSGTTTTDEPNLVFLGAVPCNTNSTLQRAIFALAGACGGVLPHSVKVIVKNETGVALASTGNSVYYQTVDGDIT
jgi:hypothetical protein